MPGKAFRRAENVGARRIGGEVFILTPAGDLLVLGNETAVFLWDAVEAGAVSANDLAARLEEEYEIAAGQAALDAEDFIRTLEHSNVLIFSEVPR